MATIGCVLQAESMVCSKVMEEKMDTRCSEKKRHHLSIQGVVFHQMQKTFQFLSCRRLIVEMG